MMVPREMVYLTRPRTVLALTGLYHTGLLPLARVLDLMSASPAALLGLDKGTLPGCAGAG